jgi:hypothetical protein
VRLPLLVVVAVASFMTTAAAPASSPFGCRPRAGLGSVALVRTGAVAVVDLATCRERTVRSHDRARIELTPGGAVETLPWGTVTTDDGRYAATVQANALRDTIRVTDTRVGRTRSVFSAPVRGTIRGLESPGPIDLLGLSGDGRWVFFAIDPGGSGAIAADGLILRVVPARSGRAWALGVMLPNRDYLAWCGGRLVFSAGRDRVATDGKRLLVAGPPSWKPTPLVADRGRSFGSIACAPDGRSLVVQAQVTSTNAAFFAAHWSLWRIGLDGSEARLTSPPAGFADESPRFSRDGRTIMFVRSHRGVGRLLVLRGSEPTGPFLSLGYSLGYYGHQDWWQRLAWSKS